MNVLQADGCVTAPVRTWLRIEGLIAIALSVVLYWNSQSSWWMFAGLLLTPDLSMLAYLVNPKVGSVFYNVVHSYVLPLAAAALTIALHKPGPLPFLFIWTAHIGMDRFFGYGLKYAAAFGATHLGYLGRASK